VGGVRAFGLLVAGIALFCLGISLSFLATATITTMEVFSVPVGKALGNADGEALVRADKDATNGPLTTPVEEAREGEEFSVRASLLMRMLVLAASPFFRSGLVLLAENSPLKRGAHHSPGVLPGGSSAAAGGRASLLGVFLL
jgi:hypothetical protein